MQPWPPLDFLRESCELKAMAMRRNWLILALLAAASIAVFWRVGRHEFINYDDPAYVTHNPTVQAGLTWPGVKWAFAELHGEATYWHPITWLSHMLDCQLYGLRPAGHHLTNLALHTLNTLLLFVVLRRITGRQGPSAIVAALFALHPLQVDTVAWIAERKNLLSTFFGLLCLWTYVRYVEKTAVNREASAASGTGAPKDASRITFQVSLFYLLSLLCFALGLMSKPMLVPLPLAMLLLDYWPLGRFSGPQSTVHGPQSTVQNPQAAGRSLQRTSAPLVSRFRFRASRSTLHAALRLLAEKLPFLALSAASSLVTIRGHESLGALMSTEQLPVPYRLANAVVAYAIYLRKVVWPVDLSVFYLHPGRWPAGAVIGSAALVLGVTALAAWQARRRPWLIVGWLWFLGMLVPTIGLVQAHVQALADRFIYLPIVGLFIMGVWAAAEWTEFWPGRRAAQVGLPALALLCCTLLTTRQLGYWRDSITLLQHAARVESRNFIARVMLGNAFFERGQLDPALREYRAAARLRPNYAEAWDHAGLVLAQQGKPGEAVPYFRKAVELAPGWAQPQGDLALVLLHEGHKDEARAAYQELTRLLPATPEGYRDLADMLNQGQQFAEAIQCYREALRLQPDFLAVLNNLALLLATCEQRQLRNGPDAVRLAERACQLTDRRDANLLGTLAAAYAQAGQFSQAIKTVQEAQAAAKASGTTHLVPVQAEMLEKFRAGKAFR
jgi:protein O-mannosyl-transferase